MGELVNYLERHGYLERTTGPEARRAKLTRMTERGWAVHETSDRVAEALQAGWGRRFGEERMRTLLDLLRALSEEPSLDR
jgi:DNA-binding MarR family transcriptional regulator